MPLFSDIVGDWKAFEMFIEGLYRDDDDVQVRRDVTLDDVDGVPRQVDVFVTFKRGPHEFSVIVECKYLKKNVERRHVDELLTTVQKLRASKGVIVTTCGYQSGALTTAEKNGIDAFLVRDPDVGEWWPKVAQQTHLQLCTYCPENRLQVPIDALEIGADDPWPVGIKTAPAVSFGRDRTSTLIQNRKDRKSLEDLIEDAVREQLEPVVSRLGVIGSGKDCVGHFTIRCDLKFANPVVVQERPAPPVFLRIAALSVNVAIRIEQRSICRRSPLELDSCAIVENCVSKAQFQVSRSTPNAPFVWMDVLQRPLVDQLPNNSRLVVVSKESFRPECFMNPWSTFGRVSNYGIDDVPQSRTLTRVLHVLEKPEP
jgi:hypothetical protein